MSQCATCHAGCCRSFAVPVTGADILRIQTRQKLSFWDFVCRWADPDGEISLNHAPQFFFRDEPQTPFVICLKHEASVQFAGTTRCQFLAEGIATAEHPCGISKCAIYVDRPAACRAFPAKMNGTGELAILYDIPAYGRKEERSAFRLCERPWRPEDLDPIQQVQDLVVAQYEMNFFHRMASGWNRRPGQWSDFPTFVEFVYANRLQSDDRADESRELSVRPVVPFPRIAA